MTSLRSLIRLILNKEDQRNFKARTNIMFSLVIRGMSMVVSFLLVPMILRYIGNNDYGVWLTLSSIITWMTFFDVGLGNGLRNKFASALAVNDHHVARQYVSTTYVSIFIISISLLLIFIALQPFLDWTKILNTEGNRTKELNFLVLYVAIFFLIRFNLVLVSIILVADQRPAISNTFDPLSNILALVIIFILTRTTSGSLTFIGVTFTTTPVFIFSIATAYLFSKDYKRYKPSFKFVSLKYFRELTGLGFRFFIIQISVVIMITIDNLVITQVFGPAEVAVYNIAFKYFSIIIMIFTIYIAAYWSAFTEAWVKGEIDWIRKTMRVNFGFWVICSVVVFIMLVFSEPFYKIWVKDLVIVPFRLSALMAIYVIVYTFTNVFIYFINGTSKIKLQLYLSILISIIKIPLSIYFAKNSSLGSGGVILASIICLSILAIMMPIQYFLIVKGKAKGIWNK